MTHIISLEHTYIIVEEVGREVESLVYIWRCVFTYFCYFHQDAAYYVAIIFAVT